MRQPGEEGGVNRSAHVLIVAEQCGAENSGMGVYAFEIGRRLPPLLTAQGVSVTAAVRRDAVALAQEVRAGGGRVLTLAESTAAKHRKLTELYAALPIRARDHDCYYSLDHKLPPRALTAGLRIATIHDTCALECGEEYGPAKRHYFAMMLPRVARSADRVVTVSSHAALRIRRLLGVAATQLIVAPNGFDTSRFRPEPEPREAERLRATYGVAPGYLLFIGRLSPRKNFKLVVDALQRVEDRGKIPVVIAGPKGWRTSEERAMIEQGGLGRHFVDIGYVSEELLPALYRQSRALLYPSLCEGFGIPVLEALACHRPVIVARGTSSAEIGGTHVVAVGPNDAASLASIIAKLHTSETEFLTTWPSVQQWLARFSWDGAAATIAGEVAKLLRSQHPAPASGCKAQSRAADHSAL